MQPKPTAINQGDLFRSRLDQILYRRHPLFRLADSIDWSVFDKDFGKLYVENVGRPGLSIRLLVGLHYLKHAFNESDESSSGSTAGKPVLRMLLRAILLWLFKERIRGVVADWIDLDRILGQQRQPV